MILGWLAAALFPLASSPLLAGDTPIPDFEQWLRDLDSRPEARSNLLFSPRIGPELDREERDRYGVFGRTNGFESARLPVDEQGRFRLRLTLRSSAGPLEVDRRFSRESLRATRLHFFLTERHAELPETLDGSEADLIWRLALRFAARGRYELVYGLLEELQREFPEEPEGHTAAALLADVKLLRRNPQALVWDHAPQQGAGSNDLKLFGGYYGLWLGLAVPLALEADSPEAYGAGLIAGGPVGYMTAAWAARKWDITEGQATMIELGGNLGTWQGLGWGAIADAEARDVVGTGVLTGLAGIGTAALLTSRYEFSEGHAALTAAAAPWGAWFGLVAATISDSGSEDGWDIHRSMLIAADAGVLFTGFAARNVEMSEKRVRLISLNGVIGTVMGFGLNLIVQPDDEGTVMGIVGVCSAAGLAAGFHLTKNVDNDRFEESGGSGLGLAPAWEYPLLTVQPNLMTGRGAMPAVAVGCSF